MKIARRDRSRTRSARLWSARLWPSGEFGQEPVESLGVAHDETACGVVRESHLSGFAQLDGRFLIDDLDLGERDVPTDVIYHSPSPPLVTRSFLTITE